MRMERITVDIEGIGKVSVEERGLTVLPWSHEALRANSVEALRSRVEAKKEAAAEKRGIAKRRAKVDPVPAYVFKVGHAPARHATNRERTPSQVVLGEVRGVDQRSSLPLVTVTGEKYSASASEVLTLTATEAEEFNAFLVQESQAQTQFDKIRDTAVQAYDIPTDGYTAHFDSDTFEFWVDYKKERLSAATFGDLAAKLRGAVIVDDYRFYLDQRSENVNDEDEGEPGTREVFDIRQRPNPSAQRSDRYFRTRKQAETYLELQDRTNAFGAERLQFMSAHTFVIPAAFKD